MRSARPVTVTRGAVCGLGPSAAPVTPAGAWQALLRYEGFLSPGMGGPEFVAPKKFVIHKAVGKLKGEEIDLLGCLEVAPLKRLPVIVRENKSIP